ncbi:MAG: DUF1836 domain-containing protein [Provencibacterium sp.]|nr:DUF1836 domain-containing protein [Provencibacterium sp.]
MADMKEEILELVLRSFADEDIRPEQIPNLDLYMDQIITIFDENLRGNKRFPEDKLLTKTMINNYSKEGVLKPVKGKKYSREHIIQMLMVYSMKNTLTIQEIKRVLSGAYAEEGFSAEELEECYRQYLTFKQIEREKMPEVIREMFRASPIELQSRKDLLVLLLSMSAMSVYMKRMAENIIDCYFTKEEN